MDFEELISCFADRHGLTGLSVESNAVALDIDDMVFTIASGGDELTISAEIGEPPVKGRAGFAELLLEANMHSRSFFAKVSDRGVYVAMQRLALSGLEVDALDAALESLVSTVETWRRILVDYRPVVEPAAKSPEADAGLSGFGGGLMSV